MRFDSTNHDAIVKSQKEKSTEGNSGTCTDTLGPTNSILIIKLVLMDTLGPSSPLWDHF